jgi:hypothetical protein
MKENTLIAAPRHVVLEELRGRLNARVAAVEKRLRLFQGEFEKLALERIELRAELHVLEEQMQRRILGKVSCLFRQLHCKKSSKLFVPK